MENFDLFSLRTLVYFSQAESLSAVANKVGRTQAAVSLQLKRLENQMGCALFEKRGRKIYLNESGQSLLRYAQDIVRINDEALQNVRTALMGRVRLGLSQDLPSDWLLPVLAQFRNLHPQVRIEVRVDRNYKLQQAAASKKLDIVIIGGKRSKTHARTVSISTPLVWVGEGKIDSDEKPLQLVLFDSPCLFRDEAIRNLKSAKIPFEITFTSASLAAVWSAVRAGLGVTIRSQISVPKDFTITDRISRKARKLPSIPFILKQVAPKPSEAALTLYESLARALQSPRAG